MESAPTGLIDITILSVGVGAFDDPNIVVDDTLGVPFIKIHYVLLGTPGTTSPTGFDAFP